MDEFRLLLVDDDDIYAELFQHALERVDTVIPIKVDRLEDGDEVLPYLLNLVEGNLEEWPHMVLLDQRMRRMDGLDTLKQLKDNAATAAVPVCMMSSSDQPKLVAQAYVSGACFYLAKPLEFGRFAERVKLIVRFWTEVAVPPTGPAT